ncbi:MAG: hypothetical protein PPP58_11515 [Natronomonas sp.]
MLPLQAEFVGGGLLALAVTFLLTTLFYAVTLHLAALWVLGDEPHQRAVAVAPVPAAIAILFSPYGFAVVLPLTFVGAAIAIRQIYKLKTSAALLLTTFHYAIAVLLGFAFGNLFLS